jgi:penicillin-binding protein 1A
VFTPHHVLRALLLAALAAPSLLAQDAEGTEPWRLIQPPQSSLVVARDGSLIGEIGKEWRTSVPIKSLPKYVPQAFVAIEDHRFYEHGGVDVIGIAGAIKDAVTGSPRGASTITQQLVGNMHPEEIDRSDRSLSREVREQRAAIEMESGTRRMRSSRHTSIRFRLATAGSVSRRRRDTISERVLRS